MTWLKDGGGYVESDQEISDMFLRFFFPNLPVMEDRSEAIEEVASTGNQFTKEPSKEEEAQRAIFKAKPFKALGADWIPTAAWRVLWPVLKHHIHRFFSESISESRLRSHWRTAKIVPIRKTDKRYHASAGAYRPISLLSTLGKALESVVVERISALVEEYSLLPKAHFGARKQL